MKSTIYSLQNIGVDYGEKKALTDVNLTLKQGCFYGIIGPNGSGKTTLINALMGFNQTNAVEGEVHFMGKAIPSYKKIELARQLAIVPQEISLGFEFSVYEVVLMGRNPYIPRFASPTPDDHRLVEHNLKRLDLWQYRNQPASQLSGGEKQRVVIARALTQNTPVLLLDEPTSSLDIHHAIRVMTILQEMVINDGVTIIASIHDLNLACAFCSDLIALKSGCVQDAGPSSTIMTDDFVNRIFDVHAFVESKNSQGVQVHFNYHEQNRPQP